MEEVIEKRYKGCRQSPIRSILNQYNRLIDIIIPRKKSGVAEPKGSSSGGGKSKRIWVRYYVTTDLYKPSCGWGRNKRYNRFTKGFSQQQLIGSITTISSGQKVRIINCI